DSLNPPYKSSGEANRGQVNSRQPVVAGCDAPEVLQPVECTLDAPTQLVETLAELNGCFLLLLLGMMGFARPEHDRAQIPVRGIFHAPVLDRLRHRVQLAVGLSLTAR